MQKAIRIFLLILIIIGIVLILTQKFWVPKLVDRILSSDTPSQQISKTLNAIPISITTTKITEKNFTGTMPTISGTSTLAIKMREYVKKTIDEFRGEANVDVPNMRIKFGIDSPPATYTIDINSKHVKGDQTESIVTDVYSYTGGAHGGTVYKVITANLSNEKILYLADIIKKSEQSAFTEFIKKQLNDWRPEGSDTSVVFPDEVKDLTFNSFKNWSLDKQNLIIYFDQDTIGPGVLGATAFPLPLQKIKPFLAPFIIII